MFPYHLEVDDAENVVFRVDDDHWTTVVRKLA